MEKKNYGKSVRTRLANLMNETGYKYMYLLARYFNERLLYRVSVSQYKDNFLLKGGSLLYALDGLEARPTVDVDFMGDRISSDRETLTDIFKQTSAVRLRVTRRYSALTCSGRNPTWRRRKSIFVRTISFGTQASLSGASAPL